MLVVAGLGTIGMQVWSMLMTALDNLPSWTLPIVALDADTVAQHNSSLIRAAKAVGMQGKIVGTPKAVVAHHIAISRGVRSTYFTTLPNRLPEGYQSIVLMAKYDETTARFLSRAGDFLLVEVTDDPKMQTIPAIHAHLGQVGGLIQVEVFLGFRDEPPEARQMCGDWGVAGAQIAAGEILKLICSPSFSPGESIRSFRSWAQIVLLSPAGIEHN